MNIFYDYLLFIFTLFIAVTDIFDAFYVYYYGTLQKCNQDDK